MALPLSTKQDVDKYARADLPGGVTEHIEFFSFLEDDPGLMKRVGEEYFSARYIYKLMEGLRIDEEWAKRAQVQLQVQQYASIYEACLHHLLFTRCSHRAEVQRLLSREILKPWTVRTDLAEELNAIGITEGRPVVAAITSDLKLSDTKVRFDHKANTAFAIGIIDEELAQELIDFYAARNMIHIHAELKRGSNWTWEIDFARQAYWRLQRFRDQVSTWLETATS
jgi:hypothetical protein